VHVAAAGFAPFMAAEKRARRWIIESDTHEYRAAVPRRYNEQKSVNERQERIRQTRQRAPPGCPARDTSRRRHSQRAHVAAHRDIDNARRAFCRFFARALCHALPTTVRKTTFAHSAMPSPNAQPDIIYYYYFFILHAIIFFLLSTLPCRARIISRRRCCRFADRCCCSMPDHSPPASCRLCVKMSAEMPAASDIVSSGFF